MLDERICDLSLVESDPAPLPTIICPEGQFLEQSLWVIAQDMGPRSRSLRMTPRAKHMFER